MKTNLFAKTLCAILCILIVAAFAGCGAGKRAAAGVDPVEKLNALAVSDQTLGIAGKYTKLTDVKGSVDADLIGTWVTAAGDMTYTYSEDGVLKVTSEAYGENELAFTCTTIGDYKILCEESELSPEFYEGAEAGDTALSYTAYSVGNDVLYQVVVEEVNEDFTSTASTLVTLYRADESGSAAAAIAKNPIDPQALSGTWMSEKGSFTIEDGVLTFGEDSFNISFDEENNLVVEKDGASTVYSMGVSVMKEYDYENRTQFNPSIALGLYFTGTDAADKPNLLPLLYDYKTEYGYESWYYSGSFKLQDGGAAEDAAAETNTVEAPAN